ncbi:MAG: hypothetical protein ACI849_001496 [Patiriisocius sp.]|jgi:hypothetical protein
MNTLNKPNKSFWIIAVLALLWNIIGLFQFIVATFMQDAMLESYKETYTPEQIELFTNMPTWYYVLFGICTITGFLGSITLFVRKKLAVPLFLISLVTVLIVQGYWLIGSNTIGLMGMEAAIMPLIVILLSIFLYFYSKGATQKGWLA